MREMRCLTMGLLLSVALVTSGCSRDIFKTVDQKVAGLFGESCSFTNLSSGDAFCLTKNVADTQPALYCYKTLGTVSCYSEENPYNTERSERVRKVPALDSSIGNGGKTEEFAPVQSVRTDPIAKE